MKKIILASGNIPTHLKKDFENFVGKSCGDISFALIEDAANPIKKKDWMYETRKDFESFGIKYKLIKLEDFINKKVFFKS